MANTETATMPRKQVQRLANLAIPTLVVALAFFPRVFLLEGHDIWGDEAYSIYVSSQSLSTVVSGGIDTHPPLYHVLLHYWMMVFGSSEFAIRFLSVGIGLLIVALTYALARRLAGNYAAIFAALVAAMSPFQIYYSQEARMYALATLLCLASAYTLLGLIKDARLSTIIPYLLVTIGAMYSHYYAFPVIAAEVALVFIWAIVNRHEGWKWRTLAPILVAWFAALLAYIPWIFVQTSFLADKASARTEEWSVAGAYRLLKESLIAFGAGTTTYSPLTKYITVFFILAFVIGLAWLAIKLSRRVESAYLLLYFAAPLVFAIVVNPVMPFFYPRYVLVAVPAFYIAIGIALGALWSKWRVLALLPVAVIAVSGVYALNNYYFDANFARGGYGQMMRHIEANAGPNDVLILGNRLQEALFDYYQPQTPKDAIYFPTTHLTADPQTGQDIAKIMAEHDRAWLIMFGDPAGFDPDGDLKHWLSQHAFLTSSQGFKDAHLYLYSKPDAQGQGQELRRVDTQANFGHIIELTAAEFSAQPTRPGQPVYLTLHWQSLAGTSTRYTVFTHVLDANSQVVGQMDCEPVSGTKPTCDWQPGEQIADPFAPVLRPDTPAGEYWIEIGLYELASGKRLPVLDENGQEKDHRVLVGPILVSGN